MAGSHQKDLVTCIGGTGLIRQGKNTFGGLRYQSHDRIGSYLVSPAPRAVCAVDLLRAQEGRGRLTTNNAVRRVGHVVPAFPSKCVTAECAATHGSVAPGKSRLTISLDG